MVTVIIPSKTERFLEHTIRDVLHNATGDIQVIPVLDGYMVPDEEYVDDPRVDYLQLKPTKKTKKRQGINLAVENAKGEYVMALDAHCLVAKGFDKQLTKDHKPNWVQIPRRHRLDPIRWDLQKQSDTRPPIDYEYIIFDSLIKERFIHGYKWNRKTVNKFHVPIDDTLTFQGSCWFMTKQWYQKNNFMDTAYQGWGQEAEEISFTTWKNGGEVKTNKNTYYAHLHKGRTYGRMYWMSREENRESWRYAFNRWVIDDREFFINLIQKFSPLPKWPKDWKDQIWKLKKH